MNKKPSSIRNLGPASDIFYARANIITAEHLRNLGADAAYFLALQAGGKPHFIGYYALVMGLQGRPWNDCQGVEKKDQRKRFDAIKTRLTGKDKTRSEFEAALNALGVIPKK